MHKILIIDNNSTQRKILKIIIQNQSCDIDSVSSIEEVDILFNEHEYNVVIIGSTIELDFIGRKVDPSKCIIICEQDVTENLIGYIIDTYNIKLEHILIKPIDKIKIKELIKKIVSGQKVIENEINKTITKTLSLYGRIKSIGFKNLIAIIIFVISMPALVSTYSTYRAYNYFQMYNSLLENYCESRFRYFRKDDKVSSCSYIEKVCVINDRYEIIIRIFPDDFISILIISTDNKFEPKKYWVAGTTYLREIGIDKDKSFWKVFVDTWFRSSQKIK